MRLIWNLHFTLCALMIYGVIWWRCPVKVTNQSQIICPPPPPLRNVTEHALAFSARRWVPKRPVSHRLSDGTGWAQWTTMEIMYVLVNPPSAAALYGIALEHCCVKRCCSPASPRPGWPVLCSSDQWTCWMHKQFKGCRLACSDSGTLICFPAVSG